MRLTIAQWVARLVLISQATERETSNPLALLLRLSAAPLVALGVRFRVHPNWITCLSILIAAAGAWQYFAGSRSSFLALWAASIVLDYADGGVARGLGLASRFGRLLDMYGDRLKLAMLLAAWSLREADIAAAVLSSIAMVLLLTGDAICHVFPVRALENSAPVATVDWRVVMHAMLVEFGMPSFLVLGAALCVAPDGTVTHLVVAWLVLILTRYAWMTLRDRVLG